MTTSLPELPENSPPELVAAHQELIASAGGRIRVTHTYRHLKDILECASDFLEPLAPAGDAVSLLMLLCDQVWQLRNATFTGKGENKDLFYKLSTFKYTKQRAF